MLNYCSFHVTFKEKWKTKENGRKMFLTNFEKKLMDLIFCADVLEEIYDNSLGKDTFS